MVPQELESKREETLEQLRQIQESTLKQYSYSSRLWLGFAVMGGILVFVGMVNLNQKPSIGMLFGIFAFVALVIIGTAKRKKSNTEVDLVQNQFKAKLAKLDCKISKKRSKDKNHI